MFVLCFCGNDVRFLNRFEVNLDFQTIECRPYKYPTYPELGNTEIKGFRVTVVALALTSVALVVKIVALAHEREALALVGVALELVPVFCFAEFVL